MYRSIYDLKDFYNSVPGQLVHKILRRQILKWWGDCAQEKVVGIGYAQPYLTEFVESADRCFAVSPAGRGTYQWPDHKNLCVLAEETELPFETNSVDKVLLIHSLEFAELPEANLQEIWRILKGNGRLLVLTPNRMGFWSRADWSPFGQGTPYSLNQLRWFLRDNKFVYERSKLALFVPPIRFRIIQRSAESFERIMPWLLPAFGGVHMVEASKQMYAGIRVPASDHVRVRGRGNLATGLTKRRPHGNS